MGGVMSPRVVLGAPPVAMLEKRDELGPVVGPPLPRELGGVPVWSHVAECPIGERPAWEFRHPEHGRCLVLQSVADTRDGRHVYVAWVPANERAGANPVFAALAPVLRMVGTLTAWWHCAEVDGTLRPELDDTPEADAVREAWPATWRVQLESDKPGDPFADPPVPPASPSGPQMIAEVLA